MNEELVMQMAKATLSDEMPFPEIINNLLKEGVEYYHVDYLSLSFSFYSQGGGVVVAPLILEGLPGVAVDFNTDQLRAAITDSQQNGQKFQHFCSRAMKSGVQSYFVFLRGQRVMYVGRQGDHHIEWFPGTRRGDA